MQIAWHECEDEPARGRSGKVTFQPSCRGDFECDECGELIGWCLGGSEDWTLEAEAAGKPDPGTLCNECWLEHYGAQ